MRASELYFQKTGKKYVYNIMPINNIPSVLEHGIICFNQIQPLHHASIAMTEVQARRDKVEIPNGLHLHEYANFYFSYHNPMLYKRKDQAEEFCILALSSKIIDIEGCIVSDRNAAAALARFYSPHDGLEELDFTTIHAKYWTDPDLLIMREKKAIKCAEILIPYRVPPSYIVEACVVNEEIKIQLKELGFDKKITINPHVFFK